MTVIQSRTLATPRRRYGADARLLFKLEDLVFGPARTLPKFRARELIARTPYQSWERAAYLKADQRGNGRSRAEKLFRTVNEDRAEQDNEEWHIILLEEQIATSGVHANPIRVRVRGTGRRASGVGDHSIPLGGRGRLRVLRFAGRHVPSDRLRRRRPQGN